MRVLIGTTNPSKVRRFEGYLADRDIEFLTLRDLGITAEPAETGRTPEENAIIKANFYGQFFDRVICNDSGLYFDSLPLTDPRQPGLNIRTPQGRPRMSDDEALEYYAALIHTLGGRVLAYYLDAIAVYDRGRVSVWAQSREDARDGAFLMVDTPDGTRHPGWPLDSLSINRKTLTRFTDKGNDNYDDADSSPTPGERRRRVVAFLTGAFGDLRL